VIPWENGDETCCTRHCYGIKPLRARIKSAEIIKGWTFRQGSVSIKSGNDYRKKNKWRKPYYLQNIG